MKLLDIKEKIWLIEDDDITFPKPEDMENDLVAIGGDFHPERLINAYENGLFPWFIDDWGYINWYSPKKRMVLKPDEMIVSKSLKKSINNRSFVVKSNTNFSEVIENCSNIKRKHEDSSWISSEFIEAYTQLYDLEIANSIEVYLDNKLVGGLYGLLINDIFCGESMFSLVNDASKVAFYHLCFWAKNNDIKLIDCQVYNSHLKSLGAYEINREEYFKILKS